MVDAARCAVLGLACLLCASEVRAAEEESIVWPSRKTRYRTGTFAGGRVHTRDASAMVGAGMRAGGDPKQDVAWQLDALVERSIQPGTAHALSVGMGFSGHTRWGSVLTTRHGFGVRGGIVSYGSSPTIPSEYRFWVAPVLASHMTIATSGDFAVEVASEVGYTFLTRGEHDSFRGLYLGIYVGPSIFFQ